MLDEQQIKNPDSIYGTAPFWAWNGPMTRDGIKRTVADMKAAGFGGAFVHPRPGLTNEYLSGEWFELWQCALEEAKEAGLKLYIYDENTYPTGYAGGHIMSQFPDCAAQSVKVRVFESREELKQFQNDPSRPEEERRWVRLYRGNRSQGRLSILDDVTEAADITELEKDEVYIGLGMQTPYASVWFGGFPNTDILRPEVTKALLDSTYEEYSKHFQEDFGTVIPAIFSDEPGITPGNVWLEDPMVFPFSRYFAAEFYRRNGYTFEDNMVCIPLDMEQSPDGMAASKVRFDYYCTLRKLWAENFAKPIQEWCEAHHIAWTGHFLDEHWPYPWGGCAPAVMSMYEYMQWPGIDMLMSHMLKENGTSAMLLSVKELSSVGSQLGKERLLCECYGAGGWDAAVTDFKRIGDWLAIHGITFFNQHLWLHSLTGIRKHEHPQSFDPREPWWEEYARLTSYYARLSYLLSQGRPGHRVLVLNPSTSWFIRRPDEQKGDILWGYEGLPEDDPVKTYIELLQRLNQNNIGFDLGDEFILQNHGSIKEKQLLVGKATYDCVVIPSEMVHMLSSTVNIIEAAFNAGVKVYCLGEKPVFVDGEVCGKSAWNMPFRSQDELLEELYRQKFQIVPIWGNGIECTLRQLETGEHICCFSNSTPKEQCCLAELTDTQIWRLDLFTGEKCRYLPEYQEGKVKINLHTCEMLALYWCDPIEESQAEDAEVCEGNADIYESDIETDEGTDTSCETGGTYSCAKGSSLTLANICLKSDNVLVLDYGSLYLRGKEYQNIHVMAASEKVFHAHGMEQNPWDMAVQFKSRYMERNRFREDSGFTMKYSFEVSEIPERIWFACERPQLYHIWINGRQLAWNPQDIWLDEEFGKLDIRDFVEQGNNEICIEGAPFDLMMELQPVYVLGDFNVEAAEGKFILKKEKPYTIGGLKAQGAPFYGGRVQYEYQLSAAEEERTKEYGVVIEDYEGTALSLYVNGNYAGQAGIGMGEVFNITPWMKAGMNELIIEVSCSLKNVFGPFHTEEKIRNSAWPAAWKQAPVYQMPAPWSYDTIDYGLKTEPVLIQCK